MDSKAPSLQDHQARSDFIRKLVQRRHNSGTAPAAFSIEPPKTIVQFWDNLDKLPEDVWQCIVSWRNLKEYGFDFLLYDHDSARHFIAQRLGPRYEQAYNSCYHPAMQADYFRLCYIFVEGGCYLDADDVYQGTAIEHLFRDGRLRIQPLCYDSSTDRMVSPSFFTHPDSSASSWIFYFNNNPLIAVRGHPILERALAQATDTLERHAPSELPEIQSTTGPGNLTKSIFDLARKHVDIESALLVLCDWEDVAITKWPLSYRNDARNWRLSNQRDYRK